MILSMFGDWLQVPAPAGDHGSMCDASVQLSRRAEWVADGASRLSGLGAGLSQAWEGEAAKQFAAVNSGAVQVVGVVATVQGEAARALADYADDWEVADRASVRAVEEIDAAIHAYRRDAQIGLTGVGRAIATALASDSPDLDQAAVARGLDLQRRVTSWQPPVISAEQAAELSVGSSAVGTIPVGWGSGIGPVTWGASRLLDDAESVGASIDADLGALANLVRRAEDRLSEDVTDAHRRVGQAMSRLRGSRAAAVRRLGEVATELERLDRGSGNSWLIGRTALRIAVGDGVWAGVDALIDAAVILGSLSKILFDGFGPGRWDGRRVGSGRDFAFRARWRADSRLRRRAIERADLADWAYSKSGATEGWIRAQNIEGPEDGQASVFRNADTGQIVVAFRGTNKTVLDDWAQNSVNAGDVSSAQGRWAISLAREMGDRFPDADVSYVGHSLGGSLASTASIATGRDAYTFNAAGVGDGNYRQALIAGQGVGASEKQIMNFQTPDDVLSLTQAALPIDDAAGTYLTVPSLADEPISAHDLANFDWTSIAPAEAL